MRISIQDVQMTAAKREDVIRMEVEQTAFGEVSQTASRAIPWRTSGLVAQSWRPEFPRSLFQATSNGMNSTMYRHLGAHPDSVDGIAGTKFTVWAPNAREVSILCDANGW